MTSPAFVCACQILFFIKWKMLATALAGELSTINNIFHLFACAVFVSKFWSLYWISEIIVFVFLFPFYSTSNFILILFAWIEAFLNNQQKRNSAFQYLVLFFLPFGTYVGPKCNASFTNRIFIIMFICIIWKIWENDWIKIYEYLKCLSFTSVHLLNVFRKIEVNAIAYRYLFIYS